MEVAELEQPQVQNTPPVDEYGIPVKKQTDEYGIPIKRNPTQNQHFATNQSITEPQQQSDLTPVLPDSRNEVRQAQIAQQQQEDARKKAVSDNFKKIKSELSPEAQKNFDTALDLATKKQPDTIREPSKEEMDHYNFMQTPTGKVLGSIAYLGSKATKGTVQVAKGAAYLANMGVNAQSGTPLADNPNTDKVFDKINDHTDFGLTKGDQQRIEESSAMRNLGGLAEFLPAAAAAAGTGGATLYLQGLGQGQEAMEQAEKSGAKINPLVKNAFILGTGAVNGYLMGDLGNSMFKSLPAGLRGDITASITADAIKQAAGKEITSQGFKDLLDNGAKTFEDKLMKGGIATLDSYNHAVKNLGALTTANFVLKKAVDAGNEATGGDGVFNEEPGVLASNLADVATKQAPFFAIPGAIGAASKLTPYSEYKNSVIESLMHDSSPENVEKTKQDITNFGQQHQWTPDETQATVDHIDKLVAITKVLPKNIPESKMTDAVNLVQGRNDLQEQLAKEQEQRKQLDPAVQDVISPNELLLTDKVEQANDKLKALATGTQLTVSKGTGDDESKFFKTIGGKKEEITESRYKLDALERDSKNNEKSNEDLPVKEEISPEQDKNEPTGKEAHDENVAKVIESGKQETTENSPIKSEQNEKNTNAKESANGEETVNAANAESGVKPNEEKLATEKEVGKNSGEAKAEPETTESKEEITPDKEVKKKILTQRAYEGEISDDVKKYLEEKGLTRNTFSQEERSKQADALINKFGEDGAYHAVKSGDVDGGMAASVLAKLQIRNSRAMDEFPTGSDEREGLAKHQANIIDLMEKKGYLGGEFNGQLAHEYQNEELNYASVKRQVEKLTGKEIGAAQEKHIKTISAENETLKNKLQDAEAKLIEETDKAFKAGEEAAKDETKAQRAKRIATKLRENAKIHRPGVFNSATPATIAWDTAVEIVAKSIETGGKLADAIELGIEHIKKTEWYKSLSAPKKQLVEKEFKQFNNDRSGSTDLADLQERFLDKNDNKFTPSEARDVWGYMKENYLDKGASYRDALSKTADDLGLSWRQVSEAITTPKVKRMSDEMWKRQADYTRNRIAIKNWIGDQNKTKAGKILQKVSGLFRGIAVFGHGGIFMGTHAGMTFFNPSTWSKTIPAFFKGWKFAYGNEGDYERSMEELKNSQNYVIAQRAGLKNNPERLNAEEYQRSQKYLGKLGLAGEKGFNAIKVLRQGLFDYHYSKLSPAERDDPTTAVSIAHLVNLATGATNVKLPSWVNEVSFAGGMEAARWEKLTASPMKATEVALKSIFTPSKVTTADRIFAKVWAKRVGAQLATYGGLLLANSAIQNTINPRNKVNLTNPDASDFLKFKFGDVTIDPTSGMRSTAMFIYDLARVPFKNQKELHGDKRIKLIGKDIAGYARGKLSPLYSTGADFIGSQDFSGNVMPYSKDKPNAYSHKLSWPEYAFSKAPLPIAEAINVTYQSALDHHANKITLDNILNGMVSGAISGTTGVRVEEYDAKQKRKDNAKH